MDKYTSRVWDAAMELSEAIIEMIDSHPDPKAKDVTVFSLTNEYGEKLYFEADGSGLKITPVR